MEPTVALQPLPQPQVQPLHSDHVEILQQYDPNQVEVLAPPPEPVNPNAESKIPDADGAEERMKRNKLIRHVKRLCNNPMFEKETIHLKEINLAEVSTPELQEMIYEIEDMVTAAEGLSVMNHVISKGFHVLEVQAAASRHFPLRIQGLSNALELNNPLSAYNRKLALIEASATSGYRISPAVSLGIQTCSAIAYLHFQNSAVEQHQDLLNSQATKSAQDAVNLLPDE